MKALTPIGEWIQEKCERLGLTQAELAERAGVSEPTISRLISGDRRIGKDVARKLAAALGVKPEEVFKAAGEWGGTIETDENAQEIMSLAADIQQLDSIDKAFIIQWIRLRNKTRDRGRKSTNENEESIA